MNMYNVHSIWDKSFSKHTIPKESFNNSTKTLNTLHQFNSLVRLDTQEMHSCYAYVNSQIELVDSWTENRNGQGI